MENIIFFLKSTATIMIPIFYAALGGLFTALAGILNIALEGMILMGAFSSLAVFYFTGNYLLAITCAIFSTTALAALHAFSIFRLRANIFITGLAINLLSSGICAVFSEKLFDTKGVVSVPLPQDPLGVTPTMNSGTGYSYGQSCQINTEYSNNFTGETSALLTLFIIFGLFLLIIIWLAIYKTPFGYRLRACEKNSDALVSLGINPTFYKTAALIFSGILCGIGGSFLSLNLAAYVPGMSSGKGWIALAVIFLGAKKPLGIPAAAFIFALAESFSNYAQGFWSIPADFILIFPYVFTLIAIIGVSIVPKKTGL